MPGYGVRAGKRGPSRGKRQELEEETGDRGVGRRGTMRKASARSRHQWAQH